MRNTRKQNQNLKLKLMMIKTHMNILILTQKNTVMMVTSKNKKLQKKKRNQNFLMVLSQIHIPNLPKQKKMDQITTMMTKSILFLHHILTTILKLNRQIILRKRNQMPKNSRTLMSLKNENKPRKKN